MLKKDSIAGSEPLLPGIMKSDKAMFRRFANRKSPMLNTIASTSRVLIIEGISGSGKDRFQTYLKAHLKHRNVHDYTEGELLQSWNQLQIAGILKIRLSFMKAFVRYVRDTINRDNNATFILNRFHLSAYVLTIVRHTKLGREYQELLNLLGTLPAHVFILHLDEWEIQHRSLHPERSAVWRTFQDQIAKKEGFRDKVERYIWQQNLMLETARSQNIPYSLIRFPSPSSIGAEFLSISGARNHSLRAFEVSAAKKTQQKRSSNQARPREHPG